MIILGIETSCDETSIGIIKGRRILSNIIYSQDIIHQSFGGIVPELASREHLKKILPIFQEALSRASISIDAIDAIGVTNSPGLKGSLIIGISFAAGLAYSLEKPLYFVDHLYGHIASNFIKNVKFPCLGLVVSGGHTSLFYIKNHVDFELVGRTLDDACGEAFDKVARILKLPYPGGPYLEKLACEGNEKKIDFPRPYLHGSLNFSFSGIKTAVFYHVKKEGLENKADVAASFQKTITDTIIKKMSMALEKYPVQNFLFGGGVIQNQYIRDRLREHFEKRNIKILIPEKNLCMDNGAMAGIFTYFLIKYKIPPSPYTIKVIPTKLVNIH
ncbi:MAG: tRNA (adenosine(37)-N6)-threonylcarbamoyltransferase complex transferase subunit TsaD [Candidatus Omnitrophica bacterium]|nr:tRNA (adenosine(37)-N6)-threonylcarbamoyltransferase complex transferase subunit TsaD [Candidatus Omnitrophota bacterium]